MDDAGSKSAEAAKSGGGIAFAGALATAVAFGPARNGYGLFLPWLREEFGLSIELAGLIASGGYAGYMLALLAVGVLATRLGPRPLVMAGTLSAALGMMLVALSSNIWALAGGVALAASSAGWAWSPYNDAVKRHVAPRLRPRVLSVVSTGTTFGIAGAGATALVVGESWRLAWVAFSAAAVVALACNAVALPGRDDGAGGAGTMLPGLRLIFKAQAAPLFIVASSFGVVSSVYYSFAVDHVSRNGDLTLPLGAPLGPLLFVVLGVAGLAGFFTGDAVNRFGLGKVLATILFAAVVASVLLGVAPGSWIGATVSAVMFGAYVMAISALLSVWSSLAFPERPSAGFSAVLGTFALGSILAPVSMGLVAGDYGYGVVFLISGTIATLTILVRPGKR